MRRGCQSAQKMAKNWLMMFKIWRLKFDSISLTDESPTDKENSIWGRNVQNQMFMDSIKLIECLIEFMEGLIARKVDFEVNLGFNRKKLKFWGQIIIFES
jgi:hypothetical protein